MPPTQSCPDEGCTKVQLMQNDITHLQSELNEIKQALKELLNGKLAQSAATVATLVGIVVTLGVLLLKK